MCGAITMSIIRCMDDGTSIAQTWDLDETLVETLRTKLGPPIETAMYRQADIDEASRTVVPIAVASQAAS